MYWSGYKKKAHDLQRRMAWRQSMWRACSETVCLQGVVLRPCLSVWPPIRKLSNAEVPQSAAGIRDPFSSWIRAISSRALVKVHSGTSKYLEVTTNLSALFSHTDTKMGSTLKRCLFLIFNYLFVVSVYLHYIFFWNITLLSAQMTCISSKNTHFYYLTASFSSSPIISLLVSK